MYYLLYSSVFTQEISFVFFLRRIRLFSVFCFLVCILLQSSTKLTTRSVIGGWRTVTQSPSSSRNIDWHGAVRKKEEGACQLTTQRATVMADVSFEESDDWVLTPDPTTDSFRSQRS